LLTSDLYTYQYTADPCKPPNGLILEIDKYDSFVRVWHVDILPDVVREAHKVFLTYFCHDEVNLDTIYFIINILILTKLVVTGWKLIGSNFIASIKYVDHNLAEDIVH